MSFRYKRVPAIAVATAAAPLLCARCSCLAWGGQVVHEPRERYRGAGGHRPVQPQPPCYSASCPVLQPQPPDYSASCPVLSCSVIATSTARKRHRSTASHAVATIHSTVRALQPRLEERGLAMAMPPKRRTLSQAAACTRTSTSSPARCHTSIRTLCLAARRPRCATGLSSRRERESALRVPPPLAPPLPWGFSETLGSMPVPGCRATTPHGTRTGEVTLALRGVAAGATSLFCEPCLCSAKECPRINRLEGSRKSR